MKLKIDVPFVLVMTATSTHPLKECVDVRCQFHRVVIQVVALAR